MLSMAFPGDSTLRTWGGQLSVQKQERQQFEVKGKEVVGSCTLAFSSLKKESGETAAQENAAPPL